MVLTPTVSVLGMAKVTFGEAIQEILSQSKSQLLLYSTVAYCCYFYKLHNWVPIELGPYTMTRLSYVIGYLFMYSMYSVLTASDFICIVLIYV